MTFLPDRANCAQRDWCQDPAPAHESLSHRMRSQLAANHAWESDEQGNVLRLP
jgi:hypothetical protein